MQIIDMTASILYDQEHAQSSFLSLINACVSHELRNPLNSIMAQNIEKVNLYAELSHIIESLDHNGKEYIQCMRILKDLHEGFKVQDSSANIMSFMVQDLLDYA
jgi:signal transduction histidine kinase